jgi:DNA-binding transcriptional ArsR family regulator
MSRDRSRARAAAPVFAALGDETRLRLLEQLCARGPESIARLSAHFPVSRQAISKHLSVLSDAGLVRAERSGRESLYAIEPRRLLEAHEALARISRDWDAALARLRAFVERPEDADR